MSYGNTTITVPECFIFMKTNKKDIIGTKSAQTGFGVESPKDVPVTEKTAQMPQSSTENTTEGFSVDERDGRTDERRHIVIVGGGFGGLTLLKHIDTDSYTVTVIDHNNYHSFPPLFYQLASGGLDASSINFPLRHEIRNLRAKGCRFHMGTVLAIDAERHTVRTDFETISYDILAIAAGTTNNFFGMEDLHKYVYTLKSTSEAMRCRNDILDRLERASLATDAEVRRRLLTFTVIGGGPTGVEISGALGELKRYILPREYPNIDPAEMTVTIVEGTDKLLGTMSPQASRQVLKDLRSLMVDIRLNSQVKGYGEDHIIRYADGTTQYSDMVIWTAGVRGNAFAFEGKSVPEIGHGTRLKVDEFNRVTGVRDVFAIGDIALCTSEAYPHGHPQVAQVAIQSARRLAKNLNSGKFDKPFVYKDKGSMATVGRNRAVVDLRHVFLHGYPAWMAWMMVHLMSLLGMRNKITVFVTWIWAYFSYSSTTRLLLRLTRWPVRTRWADDSPAADKNV